jgi:hypothetical protein
MSGSAMFSLVITHEKFLLVILGWNADEEAVCSGVSEPPAARFAPRRALISSSLSFSGTFSRGRRFPCEDCQFQESMHTDRSCMLGVSRISK